MEEGVRCRETDVYALGMVSTHLYLPNEDDAYRWHAADNAGRNYFA